MDSNQAAVVLVTGGARRLGAEIVRQMHAAGARVVVHFRSSGDEAAQLAATLNALRPGSVSIVQADLLSSNAGERLVAAAVAAYGRLDALVNNASSFFPTPLGTIDEAAWSDLVGSNLKAPLFITQAATPYLKLSRGCVVNIVDIHAERPLRGYPVYCAAKAGLAGLTRALAQELAPEVRVNGVSPGAIEWPDDGQFAPQERAAIIEHSLLKRIGAAADIAGAVRFLVFDAPYVTGQILAVDGGRSAHL
ncbi:MAG: pteridine reductase [Rhodocyclaceae bacterium]|nr:pteridine reductase [Rhodocyclaceae bacterium]MCB1911315.1 pteridine reductase [Rhodocyclaceae bacterium]MCP5232204.1 pteridine reductase [Zoogloeaceae bacterium]MCP5253287.1 pteridine reductase [Zoogloeaceae bacterium]MCW5615254.1 pteridine reductase [Rhodocyclaceae bacterium]